MIHSASKSPAPVAAGGRGECKSSPTTISARRGEFNGAGRTGATHPPGMFRRDFIDPAIVRFVTDWTWASDRLLASGFHAPGRFAAAADEAGVTERDVAQCDHADLFIFLHAFGTAYPDAAFTVGETEYLITYLSAGFGLPRDRVAVIAWSAPSGALADNFAAMVREYAARAAAWHRMDRLLTDARPLHAVASEVLADALNGRTRGILRERVAPGPRLRGVVLK